MNLKCPTNYPRPKLMIPVNRIARVLNPLCSHLPKVPRPEKIDRQATRSIIAIQVAENLLDSAIRSRQSCLCLSKTISRVSLLSFAIVVDGLLLSDSSQEIREGVSKRVSASETFAIDSWLFGRRCDAVGKRGRAVGEGLIVLRVPEQAFGRHGDIPCYLGGSIYLSVVQRIQ